MRNKITFTQCSVCKETTVNGVGSTRCCGGIHEWLFEDEVLELGIDPEFTNNKGCIRPNE